MAEEKDNEIPDLPSTEAIEAVEEGGQVNEGQSESRVGSSKSTKAVNIPNLLWSHNVVDIFISGRF